MNKNDKLFLDLMKNPYKTKSVKQVIDNDNLHNEIIGGPDLGRHLTLKLTARF